MESAIDKKTNSAGLRLALGILRVLARQHGHATFMTFRKELDNVPAATLSRILKVMIDERWVYRSVEGGYSIGDVYRLSVNSLSHQNDLGSLLQPVVKDLAIRSGESAAFVTWEGDGFLFRSKFEMPDSFHYRPVGDTNRCDAFLSALGMLCMAWQPEKTMERMAKVYLPEINDEILKEWKRRFRQMRQTGRCRSLERGLRFASAVMRGDEFVGAIAVSMIPRELAEEDATRFESLVQEAGNSAGQLLAD